MSPVEIIAAARDAIGTPFRHQGRVSGKALDCAGLVIHVAKAIGADYIDSCGYSRRPANGLLELALDDQPCLERVPLSDRQPGDVLLMRFTGDPQHLGICAGENIIHSYSSVGAVCEHRLDDVWATRIVRVYRFRGIK